jgi:hypothetical protein
MKRMGDVLGKSAGYASSWIKFSATSKSYPALYTLWILASASILELTSHERKDT